MKSYLTSRPQLCKINNSFSKREKVLASAPQISFLDLLLFNIFKYELFLFLQECYPGIYANDSTMYTSDKSISIIINSLSHDFTVLSKWFDNIFVVLNPGKCSFKLLDVDDELQANLVQVNETLENRKQENVLGVTHDIKIKFANAITSFNALTSLKVHDYKAEKSYVLLLINSNFFIAH